MKKPLASIITDLHIDENNFHQVKDVIIQSIDKSIILGLSNMFVGGDIFTSRKSQGFNVLHIWFEILDYCESKNFSLIGIPGNHDKLDYTSHKSYLDIYKGHPAFSLVTTHESRRLNGEYTLHLIPYFDEKDVYPKMLDSALIKLSQYIPSTKHLLLTHIAINGVRNNDGSLVEGVSTADAFKKFTKVFVGHYHDRQKVGDNIYYIGAIMQKNYGEDVDKGMTILYDDGSHELHPLQFQKFETIKIDMDLIGEDQLNKMCEHYGFSQDNIRFKFTGTKQKLDALDKSKFDNINIDVKCEYKDPNIDVSYNQAIKFSGFDDQKIREEWTDFSDKNEDIDQKTGINYLDKVL